MAVSAGFMVYVGELFAPWAPVTTKRMFGGGGILRDGRMFGLLADDQIYLKVNAATQDAFEAAGATQFVFETKGGGRMAMSYWSLPAGALDDPDVLIEWADRAWSAAEKPKAPAKASGKPGRVRGMTARELAELPLKPSGKPQVSIKKR